MTGHARSSQIVDRLCLLAVLLPLASSQFVDQPCRLAVLLPLASSQFVDQPNNTSASRQRGSGTRLTLSIASVSGTSTISVPRRATMCPKRF